MDPMAALAHAAAPAFPSQTSSVGHGHHTRAEPRRPVVMEQRRLHDGLPLSSNPNLDAQRPLSLGSSASVWSRSGGAVGKGVCGKWRLAVSAEATGSLVESAPAAQGRPGAVSVAKSPSDLTLVDPQEEQVKKSGAWTEFSLVAAAKVIPHPEKVEKGGEDAFFFRTDGYPAVLCVADGVGGWANDGVDPSLYSREFVKHTQEAVEVSKEAVSNPRRLLEIAHEKTESPGATTAVMAVLSGQRKLSVANLGDSGLRVVRKGQVIFGTPPHQHYFDCPFQFGSESPDTADDAQVFEVKLEEGDTIVVASDGLFDNVYDRDIGAVVSVFGGNDVTTAEHTAAALAALASKHAGDRTYDSPYSQEAIAQGQDLPFWQKMLGRKLTGGKLDDITVVVAHVVWSPHPSSGESWRSSATEANGAA